MQTPIGINLIQQDPETLWNRRVERFMSRIEIEEQIKRDERRSDNFLQERLREIQDADAD
jgi:hypothetical protein